LVHSPASPSTFSVPLCNIPEANWDARMAKHTSTGHPHVIKHTT
jgi:hypothetical protein